MSALGIPLSTALFPKTPTLRILRFPSPNYRFFSRQQVGFAKERERRSSVVVYRSLLAIYTCLERTRGRIEIRSFACISWPLFSALRFPQFHKQRAVTTPSRLLLHIYAMFVLFILDSSHQGSSCEARKSLRLLQLGCCD